MIGVLLVFWVAEKWIGWQFLSLLESLPINKCVVIVYRAIAFAYFRFILLMVGFLLERDWHALWVGYFVRFWRWIAVARLQSFISGWTYFCARSDIFIIQDWRHIFLWHPTECTFTAILTFITLVFAFTLPFLLLVFLHLQFTIILDNNLIEILHRLITRIGILENVPLFSDHSAEIFGLLTLILVNQLVDFSFIDRWV